MTDINTVVNAFMVGSARKMVELGTALGTRREPFNFTPSGGLFDFVRLPARTMHSHGAYVWCLTA